MNYDYRIDQRSSEKWPDDEEHPEATSRTSLGYRRRRSNASPLAIYNVDDVNVSIRTSGKFIEGRRKRSSSLRPNDKRYQRPAAVLWTERLIDGLRSFVAFLFSNVGIVCLVVGYTIAGAFIFVAIEGSHENTRRNTNVSIIRNNTATRLWNLTSQDNIFSKVNWRSKVDNVLREYQERIVIAVKEDDYDGSDDYMEKNKKWGFAGSFLYSLTVITTIGYGNTCPKTIWGKAVTIVYAMFGMPLFLLYLSNIGDILARSFKWTYARCCLCRCRNKRRSKVSAPVRFAYDDEMISRHRSPSRPHIDGNNTRQSQRMSKEQRMSADGAEDEEEEESDEDDDDPRNITVPLTLCLAIMVGYICGGAQLFAEWEAWNFLDGSYFCFVSLSTIGFGDIVPGDRIYAGQDLRLSSVFCSMYLMLGMALIAMCFNLMQEEVVAKIRSLTRSVQHVLSCNR